MKAILLTILTITARVFAGQNSELLFFKEYLGSFINYQFINQNELMAVTERGLLARVDSVSKRVLAKKNLGEVEGVQLKTVGDYSLVIRKVHNQVDLFKNENLQLVWSIEYDTSDENFKFDLLNRENDILGVLMNSKRVKTFDKDSLIGNIEANEGETYLEFIADSDKTSLFLAVADNKGTVKINKVKFNKRLSNEVVYTAQLPELKNISSVKMTKNFCFVLFKDKTYRGIQYVEGSESKGRLDFSFDSIEKIVKKDKIIFPSFNQSENKVNLLNLPANSLKELKIGRGDATYSLFEDVSGYWFHVVVKAEGDILPIYKMEGEEMVQLWKVPNHKDHSIKNFIVNPFARSTLVINTKEDKIIFCNKDSIAWVFDQALADVQYSRMVTYFQDEKQDEKIHYHNSLNSLIRNRELTNTVYNILYSIINDLREVSQRIQSGIQSFLETKRSEAFNTPTNVLQSLIVFTKKSEELYVIDPLQGRTTLQIQFKNKQLHKIFEEKDGTVSIVFKDKRKNIFHGVRMKLEGSHLEEDPSVVNRVITEEEIKAHCKKLVETSNEQTIKNVDLQYVQNTYTLEKKEKSIYGIKLEKSGTNELKLSPAWNAKFSLSNDTRLFYPVVHRNALSKTHASGKVFYRYIDSNLVLALNNIGDHTLLVTVLNALSGKTLHQTYVTHVDFSQDILADFEENLIIVNYTKKEKSLVRIELLVIEIMRREIEHSFTQVLEKIFHISGTNYEPDFLYEGDDLVFLSQAYILPRKLKKVAISQSLLNVANKYLILVFESNQVMLVDKRTVSPRRPLTRQEKPGTPPVVDPAMNSPYIDPDLAAYTPIVSLDFKQQLNVDFIDKQVDRVLVTPTELESTFLLCTQGSGFACYKVHPDKTFDRLNISFSYLVIAAFIASLMSVTFLLKKFVKRQEFKKNFLAMN